MSLFLNFRKIPSVFKGLKERIAIQTPGHIYTAGLLCHLITDLAEKEQT
jgi:hypothetical protein